MSVLPLKADIGRHQRIRICPIGCARCSPIADTRAAEAFRARRVTLQCVNLSRTRFRDAVPRNNQLEVAAAKETQVSPMRYLEWDGLLVLPCSRLSSDMPSATGNRVC